MTGRASAALAGIVLALCAGCDDSDSAVRAEIAVYKAACEARGGFALFQRDYEKIHVRVCLQRIPAWTD